MSALFHLNKHDYGTLQSQIREKLVSAILSGCLPLDKPLPSSRSLAQSLKVARNTVMLVYEELAADGYLISKARSGYFVNPEFDADQRRRSTCVESSIPERPVELDWTRKLKVRAGVQANPSLAHSWQSYPFPFIYGQLDQALFPIDNWRKCWRGAVSVQAIRDWTSDRYDSDDPLLIDQIQKRILPSRGIQADPDEILVTIGSQQALYLLCQLLLDAESRFGVEDPGYVSAGHIGAVCGAEVVSLDVDDGGLVLDHRLEHCDAVYVTPSYQCPTTVTMPLERRTKLLEMSQRHDFVIFEDDYEMEMNFESNPTPALKSLDKHGRVLYVGSLSKTLAPGLRMGFLVGPKSLIREARNLRQLMLRHPPLNNQRAVALFLAQGYHDALLRKLSLAFQQRSQIMSTALQKHLPDSFNQPSGGSSFWCRIPDHVDAAEVKKRAAAKGVLIISGDSYHFGDHLPRNYVKLGFSAISPDAIEPGIRILSELIQEQASESAGSG